MASHLADMRASKGMTQQALAQALGVSRTSVSAIENGRVEAWPRFRQDAARILGVPEQDLFPNERESGVTVGILWFRQANQSAFTSLASLLFRPNVSEPRAPTTEAESDDR